MPTATGLIALSERLRKLSSTLARRGQWAAAADTRLAGLYVKQHAALIIADEAKLERDPVRKRQLEAEACATWCDR
jgi:hypothetical protein